MRNSNFVTGIARLEFSAKRLPVILQTESAECGLVCLAMVAAYYGFRTDLCRLRARFSLSLKGCNLAQIIRYASALNLSSRPLRLEVSEMSGLRLPCILHWDFNHFVVLRKIDHKSILIHDPAMGVRRLSYDEVGKHFTGVALELTPNVQFKPANETRRIALGDLIGNVEGLWKSLGMVLAMAFTLEVFGLISPMFNQWVVDEALTSSDRDLLNVLVVGFGLMLLMQTSISLARGWTVMYLATHLNLQWAANVLSHMLRLPVAWFEKRHLGDVVSRFGSINAIQQTLTTDFLESILDGIMAGATLAMMIMYSGKLTLIVLAAVVLYSVLRAVSYRPLRDASQENLMLSAKEQSCFLETVRGVQAIKLFGRELDRQSRWLNLKVDSVNRGVRTQKFTLWFGIANTILFGAQSLLLFWLGAHMVMDGLFTVGMLLAFTSYSGQFTSRLSSLIDKFVTFRMLSLHAERLADIVLEPTEEVSAHDVDIADLAPRLELIDISFRYGQGEPWVIRNLSLSIEPGESLVLVGPSGCGKSTLAKLILGVLVPSEGEIRYGGVPVQMLGLQTYRQVLAGVMQDDQLLSGSLGENIRFFDPQIDQKRVERCATMAAIHKDIVAMPMGYHTLVGDMGTALSGGQKQRVLLARALCKSPKVLVLDEATSHLDVEHERMVNQAVRTLDFTRISIAHRRETIAMADRVIRLNNGIIEQDFRQSVQEAYA